ncbi:MAG: hypoxanthine phosphoribosyltransferase [Elusimicrobiota bacterium]
MQNDISEIIITSEQIQKRVKELSSEISKDYEGKQLMLVSVLKGATIFLADLMKNISIPLSIDFMTVSSYKNTQSSGVVRNLLDLRETPENKNILIVEDIIDTGITMDYLCENLKTRNPKSLKICSLLYKPARKIKTIKIDYLGFEVPDKFVVGYGIDYNEIYRNLPYICVLKPEVYKNSKL